MNHNVTQEQLLLFMQHTPLPERMGSFEKTRSPQEPFPLEDGGLLIVEYAHLTEDVRFQVVAYGMDAQFQVVQEGRVTPQARATLEEAGHMLRRDLLMTLEELEDEL